MWAADLGIQTIGDGLAVRVLGGIGQLYYGQRTEGRTGLVSLGMVGGPATLLSGPSAGSGGVTVPNEPGGDILVGELGGGTWVYSFGAPSEPLRGVRLAADGSLRNSAVVPSPDGTLAAVTSLTLVTQAGTGIGLAAGTALAVSTRWGSADISLHTVSATSQFTHVGTVRDTAKSYVADVGDTTHVTMGTATYLLTLSPGENGLTSYGLTANGGAVLTDSLGTIDGLWVSGAAAMQVMQVAGQTFVAIAATGSSSLSVVRINDLGCLFLTDHRIDDRTTRFDDVAAIDAFAANGRSFVVAAGSDAGFTVWEVLPGGTLQMFRTYVMETGTIESGSALGTVTAIEATVLGGEVRLFFVDTSGAAIWQHSLSLDTLGDRIAALGGETLGTGGDDLILGSAVADTLRGDAGADRLIDGDGADTLWGGAGADVFVFGRDTHADRIADFEAGIDRIDLGAWGRIYSAQALTFLTTATGAEIRYGDQRLIVASSDGGPIPVTAWSDADFLF